MGDLTILKRIKKAWEYLKGKGNSQIQIVALLNDKFRKDKIYRGTDKFISTSTFNTYINATNYINSVNESRAWLIVRALEEYLRDDFEMMWDETHEQLVSISEADLRKNIRRIEALFGTWEAYSWDLKLSEDKKEGYIHSFKVKIEEAGSVLCSTQGTTFKNGKIYLIGIDKACIELSNSGRKAFFILDIGSDEVEDIRNRKQFKLAYVDSGQYTVRSGLIAMRKTDIDYDNIACESKPVVELKEHWPELKDILQDKQFVLDY